MCYIYKAVVVCLHCQEHFVRQSFGSNFKTVQTAQAEADREKGPLQQFCQDLHNKRRCCCVVQPVWMDTKLVQVQNVKRCKIQGSAFGICRYSLAFFHEDCMKNRHDETGWLVAGPGRLHMSFSPPTPFFRLTLMPWWATSSFGQQMLAVIKGPKHFYTFYVIAVLSDQNTFFEGFLHPFFVQFE